MSTSTLVNARGSIVRILPVQLDFPGRTLQANMGEMGEQTSISSNDVETECSTLTLNWGSNLGLSFPKRHDRASVSNVSLMYGKLPTCRMGEKL
jgi:hypothetical protein